MKLGPLIKISAQRISEVVDGDPPFMFVSVREKERECVGVGKCGCDREWKGGLYWKTERERGRELNKDYQ